MNEYAAFVEHPRFGKGPRFTGLDPVNTPDGTVFCHWHSAPGVRVPNTAVVAHIASQRPATVPVTHYFDARRICRQCQRPFLFFADEQKYWYEELKFPLEADCLECVPCRKDEQQLRVARQKYDALLAAPSRTDGDTLTLVKCAILLVESSVFSKKLLPKLRGLTRPLLEAPEASVRARAAGFWSRLERAE